MNGGAIRLGLSSFLAGKLNPLPTQAGMLRLGWRPEVAERCPTVLRRHQAALWQRPCSSLPFVEAGAAEELTEKEPAEPGQTTSSPPTSKGVASSRKVVTWGTLRELYQEKIPITMITAYDFATARMVGMPGSRPSPAGPSPRHHGLDVCLCGDSLGMVSLGYSSTTDLGWDEFIYHTQAVQRGLESLKREQCYRIPLLAADLPFGTYESSVEQGVRSAIELVRKAKVEAVKIEGGSEIVPLVERLTSFGISVIGHLGLTPQRASSLGGFRAQGHDSPGKARQIISDAIQLQQAGCSAIVLEAVPPELIDRLVPLLSIPTIGIGAGPATDGQVLVLTDLLGGLDGPKAKFVPNFDLAPLENYRSSSYPVWQLGIDLVQEYILRVRQRKYPILGQHTYRMKPEVLKELDQSGWSL